MKEKSGKFSCVVLTLNDFVLKQPTNSNKMKGNKLMKTKKFFKRKKKKLKSSLSQKLN